MSTANSTDTGGPPSGQGTTSGASNGLPPPAVLAKLPIAARTDLLFTPSLLVESLLFTFFLIYFVPSLILYIKNRNHLLIRYRQPFSVIIGGVICSINALFIPIIRYFKIICLINIWIINTSVYSLYIFTFSRYVRTFFMQRLSIFKLKFSEKKNSRIANNNMSMKSDLDVANNRVSLRSSEISPKELEEVGSVKQDSVKKLESTFSNKSNGFDLVDPITYFKNLNLIINKYITIYLVFIPLFALLIYSIILTIVKWSSMTKSCVNELKAVSVPKIVLNCVILATSLYFLYQAYYKQKWDPELKYEYTVFVAFIAICLPIMQLTVDGYMGTVLLQYRVYIFQSLAIALHAVCIYEPLVRIFLNKFKVKENKLTEEEFLMKFSNTAFKAQVKEIATNTFCIENVLFFDAHIDLMNMVISYYTKRNTVVTSENTNVGYSSSDVLHKNTINSFLYKPFDNIFKPKFEQVYNLYIKEDGVAAVNIKSSTIRIIEEQMENDNYSYLMFNQAAEEIGELLYSNIYPRMK